MAPSDDPFACFGGDDDDDSDVDSDGILNNGNSESTENPSPDATASANRDRARHLVDAYNENKDNLSPPIDGATSSASPADHTSFRSSCEDQKERTSSLPWPHHPPLYLGPMELSDTLAEGGGRGYVATQDLPPGTCLLIEEPLVNGWSKRQIGKSLGLESIEYLLEMDDAKEILVHMEGLHPSREKVKEGFQDCGDGSSTTSTTTSDPLDKTQITDMISDMNSDRSHVQLVKSLVAYARDKSITNSDGSLIDDSDINRLLLTLRYNGFDSGLYLHFSIFNHNEDPSAIKFRPAGKSEYSEVRTTRFVLKGEALTLHYLENPREVSHTTRRKLLWDQHRFDIGDESTYKQILDNNLSKTGNLFNDNERGNHIFVSELVQGKFPSSSRDGEIINNQVDDAGESILPTTLNIEKSLDDLEDILVELQAIFKLQADAGLATNGNEDFDRSASLELTTCELITASQSLLGNTHHILLSRCRRLHIDAIELLLTHCAATLTEKQSVELMARFLPSVHALLESQRCRLGNYHPDVARSYNDYSMGIQALLSYSPKKLLSLKLEGMGTLDECSKMEHCCRVEKKRIEEMYPRDADEILNSVQRI